MDAEIVKGRHEALIKEDLFLRANEVLDQNRHAYSHKNKNDDLPLKIFLICDKCDKPWVGYIVKKKKIHYYKCNQKGCKCNKSVKSLHKDFETILENFSFNPADEDLIKDWILKTYHNLIDLHDKENRVVQLNLTSLRKKIADIKERHAEGKIELDVYQEYKTKYEDEISKILKEYTEQGIEKSNLDKFIKHGLKMSQNLHQMRVSADYDDK